MSSSDSDYDQNPKPNPSSSIDQSLDAIENQLASISMSQPDPSSPETTPSNEEQLVDQVKIMDYKDRDGSSEIEAQRMPAQWLHGKRHVDEEIVVKPMEEIVPSSACSKPPPSSSLERKIRPQKDHALNCPRCNSTNTKFCYYNNYSLSQPRYFCKTCRRYWTEGYSLRNIPVGGGSRKNRRSSSSSVSSERLSDLVVPPLPISQPTQNPKIIHEGRDLNLGNPSANDFKTITELIQVPNFDTTNNNKNMPSSSSSTSSQLSALELLTSGITSRSGFNSFMPMPTADQNTVYSSGLFPLPDPLKPCLNFSLDGFGNTGFGGLQSVQETSGGRLLFPFEDLKLQVSTTSTDTDVQQNKDYQHADSTGNMSVQETSGGWLLFPFEDLKQQESTTSSDTDVQQNKDHQHAD